MASVPFQPQPDPLLSALQQASFAAPYKFHFLGVERPLEAMRWDLWYLKLSAAEGGPILQRMQGAIQEQGALEALAGREFFVVGYLNAPRRYYDGSDGPGKHHFYSKVGIACTADFHELFFLKDDVFTALPEESSIWTGTFVPGPLQPEQRARQFLFFYTSRDPHSPDGMSQEVRIAATADFLSFERTAVIVRPDPRWYRTERVPGAYTTHAFRDPYPFILDEQLYLLVTAKSRFLEPGSMQDNEVGRDGVIAVYRAAESERLDRWEATSLAFSVGMPETDVSSIYLDTATGEHVITFSGKYDESYRKLRSVNAPIACCMNPEEGVFFEFRVPDLRRLLAAPPETPVPVTVNEVVLDETATFANRFVPELGGISVGFRCDTGGPCVSSRGSRPHLMRLPNDLARYAPPPYPRRRAAIALFFRKLTSSKGLHRNRIL